MILLSNESCSQVGPETGRSYMSSPKQNSDYLVKYIVKFIVITAYRGINVNDVWKSIFYHS